MGILNFNKSAEFSQQSKPYLMKHKISRVFVSMIQTFNAIQFAANKPNTTINFRFLGFLQRQFRFSLLLLLLFFFFCTALFTKSLFKALYYFFFIEQTLIDQDMRYNADLKTRVLIKNAEIKR